MGVELTEMHCTTALATTPPCVMSGNCASFFPVTSSNARICCTALARRKFGYVHGVNLSDVGGKFTGLTADRAGCEAATSQ